MKITEAYSVFCIVFNKYLSIYTVGYIHYDESGSMTGMKDTKCP